MKGNFQVRFLEGLTAVTQSAYSAEELDLEEFVEEHIPF